MVKKKVRKKLGAEQLIKNVDKKIEADMKKLDKKVKKIMKGGDL